MCCTIGMSGGEGGGLYARIDSFRSNSSMSLTTVTVTCSNAGTMRWALL